MTWLLVVFTVMNRRGPVFVKSSLLFWLRCRWVWWCLYSWSWQDCMSYMPICVSSLRSPWQIKYLMIYNHHYCFWWLQYSFHPMWTRMIVIISTGIPIFSKSSITAPHCQRSHPLPILYFTKVGVTSCCKWAKSLSILYISRNHWTLVIELRNSCVEKCLNLLVFRVIYRIHILFIVP